MNSVENILKGSTYLTTSIKYITKLNKGKHLITNRPMDTYSIILPPEIYKNMIFEDKLLKYNPPNYEIDRDLKYVIGISIDSGKSKIPLRKGDILGRDGEGIKIRTDVFRPEPQEDTSFILYSTRNLKDAEAVLNSRAYVSGNGLNKTGATIRNMATPGYEEISGSYSIDFTASKFDGKYRKLYKDSNYPVQGEIKDGFLKVDNNIIVKILLNRNYIDLQKDDIKQDDSSRHFYILKKRVTDLADNYNGTGSLGKNAQVKLLYKTEAAAAAAAAEQPEQPPNQPKQPTALRALANARAPLPSVAAQVLSEEFANLKLANGGLPQQLRNGLAIQTANNAIAKLKLPKAEPVVEPAAAAAAAKLAAPDNLNDNARAAALVAALNASKNGGDQTILQKARLRAVKSITDVVDLYFDNNVLKNGSNANQLPTKAEYDTKMNLVTISTRAFVRVCEAITGLSARSTQEHMNTVFTQLIPIVEYVDNENPTLAGLDALPIEPAPAVGGRRRTKGKGKKATKRRMAKAKAKAKGKTKSRTQRKSTRKNRRS